MPKKTERKPLIKPAKRGQIDNSRNVGHILPEPKYKYKEVRIDDKTVIKSKDIHLTDQEIIDNYIAKRNAYKPNFGL